MIIDMKNVENSTKTVSSPCVRNCCLDDQDICLGCFRSLDEIKLWATVNDQQRRQFLSSAEQRKHLAFELITRKQKMLRRW